MPVTTVILTLNEARHIERALASVATFSDRCLVVDSGSTDDTVERARAMGAQVMVHPFVNQAQQFNWALTQLPEDTDWVFRLDADEVVSDALAAEIATTVQNAPSAVAGFNVARRIAFMGRPIRYGGLFPVQVLRLFRHGRGRSDERWMDEHIAVDGQIRPLVGELLDDNCNPLGWWIDKHNRYASREVLELLLADSSGSAPLPTIDRRAAKMRWIKKHLYGRLPAGFRAIAYFLYRYLLRGGFRDGFPGLAFHVLQGFWYRFLVDAKLREAKCHLARSGNTLETLCSEVLLIALPDRPRRASHVLREGDHDATRGLSPLLGGHEMPVHLMARPSPDQLRHD